MDCLGSNFCSCSVLLLLLPVNLSLALALLNSVPPWNLMLVSKSRCWCPNVISFFSKLINSFHQTRSLLLDARLIFKQSLCVVNTSVNSSLVRPCKFGLKIHSCAVHADIQTQESVLLLELCSAGKINCFVLCFTLKITSY